MRFSAFTAHLPLEVQDSSIVLSLACSGLGNNCIFANKICKWTAGRAVSGRRKPGKSVVCSGQKSGHSTPPWLCYRNRLLDIGHILRADPSYHVVTTVKSGIFDGFFDVFLIFLKNEHDKPIGTPNRGL